jgi:hypothetical protein
LGMTPGRVGRCQAKKPRRTNVVVFLLFLQGLKK